MREHLRRALPALVGLALFLTALEILRRSLRAVTWQTLSSDLASMPTLPLLLAVGLTALNYAALTGYDFIALAYVGRRLPPWRVAVASFLAYAIANNVGFALLSGTSVRYRFYTRWGISAEELSRIVVSYSVTFWLGLLTLGGLSLALGPFSSIDGLPMTSLTAPAGWAMVAVSLSYVTLASRRRAPLRIWNLVLPMPRARLAIAQLVVSGIDWALAGAIFYVLLPASDAPFIGVLGAFMAAQLFGMISHVPGGAGVFEGLMILLLQPYLSSAQLLPTFVVYRVIYYLLPLSVALTVLVADVVRRKQAHALRLTAYLGRLAEQLTPRGLAVFTFISGLILLFSGATPSGNDRLAWLHRVVPLGVIELSHVLGSVLGAILLLLSQGLARRLDAAYYFTMLAVSAGIAVSLLKGGD